MIQNVMMTGNDNDNNCDYGQPSFTQIMMAIVAGRDDNNYLV